MTPPNRDPSFPQTQARHVRQCLREAWVVGGIWCLGLVWICGTIGVLGYLPPSHRPDIPPLVMGIPSWVFWGLFLPWMVLVGLTWLFAVCVLKDDEPYVGFPEEESEESR